jgi:hypothetical protein
MEHQIEYARSSGVAIAYEVASEGDVDLVFVPDWVSNLVYGWEWPGGTSTSGSPARSG